MSKTIIAPLVGLLIIVLKAIGFDISDEIGGEIANGIVIAVSTVSLVYGIFKNHKKTDAVKT